MIAETDEVRAALAEATQRRPGLPASELVRTLIDVGHAARRASLDAERDAVARTGGSLAGVYSLADLERLREQWPA